MRCLACNNALSNKESTRRSVLTNEFMDICDHCLVDMDIDTYVNPYFDDDNTDENQEG